MYVICLIHACLNHCLSLTTLENYSYRIVLAAATIALWSSIIHEISNFSAKWPDLGTDPLFEDGHLSNLGVYDPLGQNLNIFSEYGRERYSRKVFVGGLPPDIDEGILPSQIHYTYPYTFILLQYIIF